MLFDDPSLQSLKKQFDDQKIRKEGIVKATDKGFGFLEVSNKESYFINANNMRKLMHGDKIVAIIQKQDDNKTYAQAEKIISPALDVFIGQVKYVKDRLSIRVDSPSIKNIIDGYDQRKDNKQSLKDGDYVVCKLKSHALEHNFFKCNIKKFICSNTNEHAPWLVSLAKYNLASKAFEYDGSYEYLDQNIEHEDLLDIPFITIDSEKTQDMDDAIFVQNKDDSFILYVAIANPTGYIKYHDPIDKEAQKRSFSTYLPGQDIPMLPRELSDNLCSLRENEKRSALVGIFTINQDGSLDFTKSQFKIAYIKSHKRLSYKAVSDFIENNTTLANTDDSILEQIKELYAFAKVRDKYRENTSGTFINRPDYDFILNENGGLDHIEANYRRSGNQIVEEAMIVANICCGEFLANNIHQGIFNAHKGFDVNSYNEVLQACEQEGYTDSANTDLSTIEGFCKIRKFALSKDHQYLDSRLRKLQEMGQISITPQPHFALGVNNYATWTSPIRKYQDMLNHRLIKAYILKQDIHLELDDKLLVQMNEARRTNRLVERDVKDWLYAQYLQKDIEKQTIFKAQVFDISRMGVRLILQENGAMVFIPGSFFSANKDELEYKNQTGQILFNNEVVLKLADIIDVKIYQINNITRSIIARPVVGLKNVMLPEIK